MIDLCAWEGGSSREPRGLVSWIGGNDDFHENKAQRAFDGIELTEKRCGEVLRHDLAELLKKWKAWHGEAPSVMVRAKVKKAIKQTEDDDPPPYGLDAIVYKLTIDGVIDGEAASGFGCVTTRRVIRGWAAVNRLHTLLLAEESAENPQGDGKNPATGSVQGA